MSVDLSASPSGGQIRLVFPAEALAVRRAIATVLACLPPDRLTSDARDRAEISIAEALNNVVEHAYPEAPGQIELHVGLGPEGLACTIIDTGIPIPDAVLAGAVLPKPDANGLPEGGFGWFLIRSLACRVDYAREDGTNRLQFLLELGQSGRRAQTVRDAATAP